MLQIPSVTCIDDSKKSGSVENKPKKWPAFGDPGLPEAGKDCKN